MKKILSLVLVCVLLSLSLLSCGIDTKKAVSYKDYSLTRALFQYLCCLKKTENLYELYHLSPDSTSSRALQDNEAFWTAADENGKTLGETLKESVLQDVKEMLYLEQIAKDAKHTLTDAEKNELRTQFDKLLTSYRDKNDLNEAMAQYGVDYDELLSYTYHQNLATQGRTLLFGKGGSARVSDSAVQTRYEETYFSVQYLYLNHKTKTYPNGKTVVLPDSESAVKLALADELLSRALAGEDFLSLCAEATEATDPTAATGLLLEKGALTDAAAEKAFLSSDGKAVEKVVTDQGIYLFRRLPLPATPGEDQQSAIRSALEEEKLKAQIEKEADAFSVAESFVNSLDIATLPHVI